MKKNHKRFSELDAGVPTLFLEQKTLKQNINYLKKLSNTVGIRIATKSVRSLDVLKMLSNELGTSFKGLMAYDLREAIWLVEEGFDNILVGYPQFDLKQIKQIDSSPRLKESITLMIDCEGHLEALSKYNGLCLCLDIDLSLSLPGLNFGVYRSSVDKIEKIRRIKEMISSTSHYIVGLMGYEAQIAGVPDEGSFLSPIVRILKSISQRRIRSWRRDARSLFPRLEFFNGGGTGSIHFSTSDPSVDEITIGSGFYCPKLFDGYRNLKIRPSLMYALPVVRKPRENIVTCLGGGYVASGKVGEDKAPTPIYPPGLRFISNEMAGEVQTPLRGNSAKSLKIGDKVVFRPAKAGEICERFNQINIVDDHGCSKIVKTYRGEGKCFF